MIQNFECFDAHSRAEITRIAYTDPTCAGLASIGYDSNLRLWDLPTFTFKREMPFQQSYLFALLPNEHGFLIGNGDGELVQVSKEGNEIIRKGKFHSDCLADILEEENYYVTVGYDGVVNFIDKKQFAVVQSLQLDSCLEQIVKFNDQYYTAGGRGYQISGRLEVKEKGSVRRYLSTKEKLYASSDDKGFNCQSKKNNSYVPC
jgi:WD40 repeat protein